MTSDASTQAPPLDPSPSPSPSADIARLDPEVDYSRIVFLLTYQLATWDVERALELALFKTYASPSISGLLQRTGEFTERPRKRYDDTAIILSEIGEHGFDSDRGQRALTRMNAMHGRFRIANEDFLYVLATFIFEPMEWMARFARRSLTEAESRAWFLHYRELGLRMGIADIPETIEAYRDFRDGYERDHFVYAPSNRVIAEATMEVVLDMYLPRFLHWAGRPFIYALCPGHLLDAFGVTRPNSLVRILTEAGLGARRLWLRVTPEPKRIARITTRKTPTYPVGYRIDELGSFAASQPSGEGAAQPSELGRA